MMRALPSLLLVIVLALAGGVLWRHHDLVPHEYDPLEPLDLRAPRTVVTPWKLRFLATSPRLCRAALATADLRAQPAIGAGTQACPLDGAVTVSGGAVQPQPSHFLASCPLAVRWALFTQDVVQPAARESFGQPAVAIRHVGSFACRDIRGGAGRRSSHATADAIDVAGVVLRDGRAISVAAWKKDGPESVFLHRIRDGACTVFGIVLSPDYNALHQGHLHLQATGMGLCR